MSSEFANTSTINLNMLRQNNKLINIRFFTYILIEILPYLYFIQLLRNYTPGVKKPYLILMEHMHTGIPLYLNSPVARTLKCD